MELLKTSAVAEHLGVGYHHLFGLIRSRRLAAPAKDSSGDYVWTAADVERARLALAVRGRRARGAQGGGGPRGMSAATNTEGE